MRAGVAGLLVAGFLAASPAGALVRGGGDPRTDCLAEFGGTPANRPARGPRDVVCTDGDPACDEDPTPGVCGLRLRVCVNVTDPGLPDCAPAALDGYVVDNPQPDTNPAHDFDLQQLEDALAFLALPVDASQTDVCAPETGVSVPLRLRPRRGGGAWGTGKKRVRAVVVGPGGVADEDRITLVCRPAEGSTPCDGVTSTFEQIQRQVFTGASCARSTCHNVQQEPHELSLSPGEAWGDLVGVPAVWSGLLRVAPGDPASSFLVRKLRGILGPAEGLQMPRGLRPLPELQIRLVEEWIAAGAPADGFVAPTGCRAP